MPDNLTKGNAGVEDIEFDTAGSGTTPSAFSKTDSKGNPLPTTRVSASQVPVLDAPVVASARTPFARIAPSTDRDVEACITDTRINVRDMKNFEHAGGQAGAGVSATVAQKNTEVYKKLLDDLAAEGRQNGIFFPGTEYEFMENAALGGLFASHILPMDAVPGMMLVGTPETILRANANANTSFHLVFSQDCSQLRVMDLKLDKHPSAINGACLLLTTSAGRVSGPQILGVEAINGATAGCIRFEEGAGGFGIENFWITRCTTEGLFLSNCRKGTIERNILPDGHMIVTDGLGDEWIGDIKILHNRLTLGTNQNIQIQRIGTFDPAEHRNLYVFDNTILVGFLTMDGLHASTLQKNTLLAGGILSILTSMGTIEDLAYLDNKIDVAGINHGIEILASGTTLNGFRVQGGHVKNAIQNGIKVSFATGTARWGRIAQVLVENASRHDADATDYSSILLDAADAAGGVLETVVLGNILRNTVATGINGNLQKHGVEATAGGLTDYIFVDQCFTKGYTTSDVLLVGANSQDLNATYDGGAAV